VRKGLLLGAGFSYDFGMPLSVELTEIFLSLFNERNARRFGDILSSNEPYAKDRPINSSAIHEGINVLLAYKQENGSNYEELLAKVEALGDHPRKSQSDRDSYHYLFEVFYDLLHRILITYQIKSHDALYELNRPWFSKLGNLLSAEETWIFTLNHDLYVECLAIDFGIPVSYGDVDEISLPVNNLEPRKEIRFSCSRMEDLRKEGAGWFTGRKGVNLVHLHGSLSEHEYKDDLLICNPSLQRKHSSEVISDFHEIESMGYNHQGQRVPSGRSRVITGPDDTLDIIRRTVLIGGKKYSKTTNLKKGEEKLKLFDDVMRELTELTIIGYSFGDSHVNNRILNAMVLNNQLRIRIVDPVHRPSWPEFLQQFDYDQRIRGALCGAAQWMTYVGEEKWDDAQTKALKQNERVRLEIRRKVKAAMLQGADLHR
jgi:hypothetical protein